MTVSDRETLLALARLLTSEGRRRWKIMDESVPAVALANLKFNIGDAIEHTGELAFWGPGVVQDVESNNGVVMCRFPSVGQYGCDPRKLRLRALAAQGEG